MTSPPVDRLAHDHRALNELLLAVHEALGRVARDTSKLGDELHEIRDGIEAFREALLEHFGKEQENLLPFVAKALPSMRDRCDALVADHDRIAALLTTLVRELADAEANGTMAAWTTELKAIEAVYATHTRIELDFFDEVGRALANDSAAVQQLQQLIDEA